MALNPQERAGSPPTAGHPTPAQLTVLVLDERNEPLRDVRILLRSEGEAGETQWTGEDGRAVFQSLVPRRAYRLNLEAAGYQTIEETSINPKAGEHILRAYRMPRSPRIDDAGFGSVAVTVLDETAAPFPGVVVVVRSHDGRVHVTQTNGRGEALFEALPTGPGWDVRVEIAGYKTTRWKDQVIVADRTLKLTVRLLAVVLAPVLPAQARNSTGSPRPDSPPALH
jgi:hypothetical protein